MTTEENHEADGIQFEASCVGGRVYSKEDLPEGPYLAHRKTTTTWMTRMPGPFAVKTRHEGIVHCEDGWLALDVHDYPYPIAADEQARIYELVKEAPSGPVK